jgi:hypothetical protein
MFFWWRTNQANRLAEMWVMLDENSPKKLEMLYTENKDSNQGKAATLTIAFEQLYGAVRLLGGGADLQPIGIERLERMQELYGKLAKDYEEDAELQAEAKYGQAVATEALAVKDIANLEEAKKIYEELAKGQLAKTGFGMIAGRRLEQFTSATDYAALSTFYSEFKTKSRMAQPR